MKSLPIILLCLASFAAAFGQGKTVDYGSNPAAGKYYEIRGFKMYCEQYGIGRPLLMIHGNGGSISSFKKNIPYFAKKYRVILADSRAHGRSADPKDSLSFEMMADDDAALLDQLHIDSCYVLGWSDGGINALLLTMRHPRKVIKLASTGANLWPDSTAIVPGSWRSAQQYYNAIKDSVFLTAKANNDKKVFLLDWFQPHIALLALRQVKCPSLIIAGDHDVITLQHTVLIYQNTPHANLWILPKSGHGTLVEHTDEFDLKVDNFFTKGL